MELVNSARVSCANRKRGENWRFIALSLFPSSERSHQKIQPDKAHRPPLDDFTAVSKAERAPERSLVQPPAYDKKRLRDCSSERSEGRLPRPGFSGGAWALLHIQPISPFSLGEGGTHCFWALSPPQQCLVCSNCFFPQGLSSWQPPSEGASLSCKVLLSTGHFWCTWSFSIHHHPPFGFFANVILNFLPLSLYSVEASHGRRWHKLLVSSCNPHPSQPYSTATVHLLGRLRSCQHEFTGYLQHSRKYLVPFWRGS